jgi:hypothetical protein
MVKRFKVEALWKIDELISYVSVLR